MAHLRSTAERPRRRRALLAVPTGLRLTVSFGARPRTAPATPLGAPASDSATADGPVPPCPVHTISQHTGATSAGVARTAADPLAAAERRTGLIVARSAQPRSAGSRRVTRRDPSAVVTPADRRPSAPLPANLLALGANRVSNVAPRSSGTAAAGHASTWHLARGTSPASPAVLPLPR